MRRWWNEKDFIGIIPDKIFNEDPVEHVEINYTFVIILLM